MTSLAFKTSGGGYYELPQKTLTSLYNEFPDKDVDKVLSDMRRKLEEGKYSYTKQGMLRAIKKWIPKGPPKKDQRIEAAHKYAERVQREAEEREKAEAAIPRPDYEWVREACGRILRTLPEYHRPQPKRVDQLRCRHEFKTSFYGGGDWCGKCGMFRDQWRVV